MASKNLKRILIVCLILIFISFGSIIQFRTSENKTFSPSTVKSPPAQYSENENSAVTAHQPDNIDCRLLDPDKTWGEELVNRNMNPILNVKELAAEINDYFFQNVASSSRLNDAEKNNLMNQLNINTIRLIERKPLMSFKASMPNDDSLIRVNSDAVQLIEESTDELFEHLANIVVYQDDATDLLKTCKAMFFKNVSLNVSLLRHINLKKGRIIDSFEAELVHQLTNAYIRRELSFEKVITELSLLESAFAKMRISQMQLERYKSNRDSLFFEIFGTEAVYKYTYLIDKNIELDWTSLKDSVFEDIVLTPELEDYLRLHYEIKTLSEEKDIRSVLDTISEDTKLTNQMLELALDTGEVSLVNKLISISDDPIKTTNDFVQRAIKLDAYDVFSQLLSQGMDIEQPQILGEDMLNIALDQIKSCDTGESRFAKLIIDAGKTIEMNHSQQLGHLKMRCPNIYTEILGEREADVYKFF